MATALLVSDLTLTLWALGQTLDPPTCIQASFKGCPQLAYSLFQLMHITCDDHSVWVKRAMMARRKTKFITALTALLSRWVSPCMCYCMTAFMAA